MTKRTFIFSNNLSAVLASDYFILAAVRARKFCWSWSICYSFLAAWAY